MTLEQINSQSNSLIDKLLDAAESYKSKLVNTDTSDFADYLKDNFSTIDKDRDNLLSKKEINETLNENKRNPEIEKIINNTNIESIIANIDTNNDGNVSFKEVDPKSKLSDLASSAIKDYSHSKDIGSTVMNLTQRLGQSFYLNDSAKTMLASAVNYVL